MIIANGFIYCPYCGFEDEFAKDMGAPSAIATSHACKKCGADFVTHDAIDVSFTTITPHALMNCYLNCELWDGFLGVCAFINTPPHFSKKRANADPPDNCPLGYSRDKTSGDAQ